MAEAEPIFIEHAGHRVACIAHENPDATRLPVVWIHGLTMSVRFWEAAMYREIREHRSWYSISLPLHFPSTFEGPVDQDLLDEDLLARLVAAQVDALIPDGRFHIVGHSLGGFAALNYAAKFPGRVASIVSIGGFMCGRAKGIEGILQFLACGRTFRKAVFYTGFWILRTHRLFLKFATLTYAEKQRKLLSFPELEETLKSVYPDFQKHSIRELREFFRYLISMNLFDETAQIDAPVLFAVGEKDPVIPPEHQKACAKSLANSELHLFEGCGHLTFAEAPESFEPALFDWLSRHDSVESNDPSPP